MEVLLLLVLSCVVIVSSEGSKSGRHTNEPCTTTADCSSNRYCDVEQEQCHCKVGYQRPDCKQCPGQGEECEDCCYPPETLTCYQDDQNFKTCNGHYNHSFIMAAQVALGAALAIAFVALIILFWKTCPRGNSRGGLSSLFRERESSLTSIQRIVLERLRDRPPRYDDNYQIQLEKPPAYEEVANISSIQVPDSSPPDYSASIQESDESKVESRSSIASQGQRNSTSHPASTSSGMINPAFTTDEAMETRCKPSELKVENSRSRTESNESRRLNLVGEEMQTEHYI